MTERFTWMEDAECRQYPPETMHPLKGESNTFPKKICAMCVVRGECLEHALENNVAGVAGGLSEKERNKLRRKVS